MSNKNSTFAVICSVIAVVFAAASFFMVYSTPKTAPAPSEAQKDVGSDIQYVMYIGTNDKDTNEPVYDQTQAMQIVEDIFIKHLGGFTLQDANGGWKDGDKLYREYSIVAYISDASIDDIHAAADELLDALNQSSILIQANQTRTEFYSGS